MSRGGTSYVDSHSGGHSSKKDDHSDDDESSETVSSRFEEILAS